MTFVFLGTFAQISYQSRSVCCRLGNLRKSYIVTFFKQYCYNSSCLPVSRFLKSNKQIGSGMKCSHTGHPFPHKLLSFLTPGDWTPTKLSLLHNLVGLSPPREDYHLSLTTLGDYHPLEKIITSHSLGLGECHPLISLTITLGDYQPRNTVTCRLLLEYFIPQPFSAQLFWFSCLLP